MRLRARIAALQGHRISRETAFAPGVFLDGTMLVTEGTVSINTRSFINATAPIRIEDGVRIGCEVSLITTTHKLGGSDVRAGDVVYRPITIGRGTWVGARATVLPGVTIAPGCVIAAGAVVTESTEPNGLYAGVPAKRVRDFH